jgi:hypothetical protein
MASRPTPNGEKRKYDGDDSYVDKQPAPNKRPRKLCIVCADDVPRDEFPNLPHEQDHKRPHNSDVCKQCCSEHLSHEVRNKGHEAVGCPQCSKPLKQSEVQMLASSQTYQECVPIFEVENWQERHEANVLVRYLDKAAKACMQKEEELHACPNAECSWGSYLQTLAVCDLPANRGPGALFAKDDGNIFVCRKCEARYCLTCNVTFHEDETCEDYQAAAAKRRNEDEEKSLKTVKQVSRPCPGCGANIDKFAGCDHITCKMIPVIHFE